MSRVIVTRKRTAAAGTGQFLHFLSFVHFADQLQLFLVATFDFRALLPYVSSPGDLVVRSADTLIWCGDVDYEASPMGKVEWSSLLKEESSGELSNESDSMVWVTRYLGGKPLVFATKAR